MFERLEATFADHGITPNDCLVLECINTVPAALTLLYLLQRGYSLMLLPADGATTLPAFCRYLLTFPTTSTELTPETFFQLTPNPTYNPAAVHASEKLYARTSGSMGLSKIVVHAHDRLFGNAANCVERFQLNAAQRIMIPAPIFHMYGLAAGFLPAVMAGASIGLQDKSNLIKYLDQEKRFNPDVAFLIPALCEMFVQGRRSDRPYTTVVTAGQRIKEDIFYAFDARFGRLVNLYGSTEMGAVAAASPDDPVDLRATTIGTPMYNVKLQLDAPTPDMPGALLCQHPYGFEQYIDADGQAIRVAGEWYHTGDLAQQHPNGRLQILGRVDASVNRSGYLVLLADIEQAMEKLDVIKQVIVVTTAAESKRGQTIAAFCVAATTAVDDAHIRTACFDMLPGYAIPDKVFVVDQLPTLASGKVDRRKLSSIAQRAD